MSSAKKQLSEYTSLALVIKEFNNKYASVYPKLTRSKAIELCKANSIALYSFSQDANTRSRIYISKSVNLEDYLVEDLHEVSFTFENEK